MGVVSENILFHIFERAITRYAYSRKLPYLVQQGDVFKLSKSASPLYYETKINHERVDHGSHTNSV